MTLLSSITLPGTPEAALAQGYILAHYQLQLAEATEDASITALANKIANGQTIGTSNPQLVEQLAPFAGQVLHWERLPATADSSIKKMSVKLTIAYPPSAIASDFGTFLAVVFGKISMGGAIRLLDITIPEDSPASKRLPFPGPALGLSGLRAKLELQPSDPLLMSIFKPCLGVANDTLAAMLYELSLAGCALVKDDEVLGDTTLEQSINRLKACQEALARARQAGAKKTLYVLQLSGPAHELIDRAQRLVEAGAEAFLFNYLIYGLPMLASLRTVLPPSVALFAHPALGGCFYGSPHHGIAPACLFGTLPRLAGADAVLFPSPYGSVSLPREDALAIQKNLLQPIANLPAAAPVPSAGLTESVVPQLLQDFGADVVINAGTGIHDHPEGRQVAVKAFLKHY